MGRAIFSVQTIDRDSGTENWVRVEAASRQEAQAEVAALGEIVGDVKLVEVVASTPIASELEEDSRPLKGFSVGFRRPGTKATTWEYVDAIDAAAAQKIVAERVGDVELLDVIEMGRRLGSHEHTTSKGGLSCPKCSSHARGGYSFWQWLVGILFFPIGLLVFLIKPTYKCTQCGFRFKA